MLRVLRCGAVEATGDPFEPYRVVDVDGVVVAPVASFLRDLQACGRPAATQRSYAMDLLRWWRFLRAVDVGWDQATRVEARDFCCWIQGSDKAVRPHWRQVGQDPASGVSRTAGPVPAGLIRVGKRLA